MTFDCSQLIGDKCKRLKKACVIGQRGCLLQKRNFKRKPDPNEMTVRIPKLSQDKKNNKTARKL